MIQAKPNSWRADVSRLPRATDDIEQAKRDFTEFGYALIENCLCPDEVAALRQRLVEQATAERRAPGRAQTPLQLVRVLPNKGQVFRDLILQPQVTELMAHGFGALDFCISNLTGMVTIAGMPAQVIHCDQSYLPDPQPRAWVNNVLYMISEFTEANGGTRVIPGSHRWPPPPIEYHKDGRILGAGRVDTMAIEGGPGTALVFDGRLWHGAGPSSVPGPRLAISGYYMTPLLRQSENYPASIHDDVYAQLSREQRDMLGFKRALTLNYIEPMHEGGRTNTDTPAPFTPEMHL